MAARIFQNDNENWLKIYLVSCLVLLHPLPLTISTEQHCNRYRPTFTSCQRTNHLFLLTRH